MPSGYKHESKTCSLVSCGREHLARGYCRLHYDRSKKNPKCGLEGPVRLLSSDYEGKCSVEDCQMPYKARGYCIGHYTRLLQGRKVDEALWSPGQWNEWSLGSRGYIYRTRTIDGKRETQLQHRYIMEQNLGRALLKHENVHHINGVRDDNRIENLELWNTSQPSGQRASDKLAWAYEIIALYGNDKTPNA